MKTRAALVALSLLGSLLILVALAAQDSGSLPFVDTRLPAAVAVKPATPGGLLASYFANDALRGEPTRVRVEGPINLRWSAQDGPPDGLAAPLSIRWQGTLTAPTSGRYTLITTGDDGVRLRVGDRQLIDSWSVRYATEDRATLEMQAGQAYPITLEYFDRGYDGLIRLEWQSAATPRQLIPASALAATVPAPRPTPTPSAGLQARYFANINLQGEPLLTRLDAAVDLRWDRNGGPAAGLAAPLSIRWQGTLTAPTSERYTLIATGDDGVRLWIDGRQLIDSWSVRYATEDRATLEMQAGRAYPITLEYFDRGYDGLIRFEWQSAATPRAIVPGSAFHTDSAALQTLAVAAAPADAPEQINPLRGFYRWLGNENVPSPDGLPEPSLDSYERYEWRQLEPRRGTYDFSAIDRDIAAAAARGARHGFRIRALTSEHAYAVPIYLEGLMEQGWRVAYNEDSTASIYVPDWNDPDFLNRAEQLLQALGERYNADPRVSFIDIGLYGIWGEWHTYRLTYPSPSGAKNMTMSNRQRLIDMHLAAFPDKHLVMMTDDERSLIYALQQSPRVGWRRDSLGDAHFESVVSDIDRLGEHELALFTERWKSAPVITEFINPSRQTVPETYTLAREQVLRYHVSLISNGNTRRWQQLDSAARTALLSVGQAGGYRYALASVSLLAAVRPGDSLTIASSWNNSGIAPTYDPWEVVWQLRTSQGDVAWEGASGLDLRTLLPSEPAADALTAQEQATTDRFVLPAGLTPGLYTLALQIRDPDGQRRPMQLAVASPYVAGAYSLGTMTVGR